MTTITVRERSTASEGFRATVSFDGEGEYEAVIRDPFSPQEESRLEWYFEQHLRFPFTDQVKAGEAAASVRPYGETLFRQVFADAEAFARYREACQAGIETLCFEIIGSPEFHHLHWEALADPNLSQPLALQAAMVRRNSTPQVMRATVRPSPTINLLVVTARPGGARDVGYRTISRPLVESLRQAGLQVRVDILRPGTYRALSEHLEQIQDQHGAGFYHVIHFDVHGSLMTHEQFQKVEQGLKTDRHTFQERYGRDDLPLYDGLKAFLFLEGETAGQADPVEAGELAGLLTSHQIPVAVLNACQSGKQVGDQETSLGSRLMAAGVQNVLAMGYTVTVSAAELMMRTLYGRLFAGSDLPAAIRAARLELHNRKGRRAYFNQVVDLEDWMLPVAYQNRAVQLAVRAFTPEEANAHYERQARRYQAPQVAYGFVGRDLDVLEIERRILGHNVLLVRGMGGAGKTTLLHHLGEWWQATGFVDQVFYFGYDERAWTRQQIIHAVAERLLSKAEVAGTFLPMGLDAQQALLAARLAATRHLLILDNLESITGTHLAIRNTLPPEEQEALRRFLADLADGKTFVLLGSRGGEDWLVGAPSAGRSPLQAEHIYDLPGLDPEAASTLADRVLAKHGATKYRGDADFERLLKLLDGYPLPIEVVLANLARQTPAVVLAALEQGLAEIDTAAGQGAADLDKLAEQKTASLLRCIDYSHSNLSPEAQGLLLCLAPFTGVVFLGALEQYTARLREQPALANLPFDRWGEVLQEAANWGLVAAHDVPGFLRLQPIFPYFLRSRLQASPPLAGEGVGGEVKAAIETAFRELYSQLGGEIAGLQQSKDAKEKQLGQLLARLEYENLVTVLNLALDAQVSFYAPYDVLGQYLQSVQDYRRHLALSTSVELKAKHYSSVQLSGELGLDFARCVEDIGLCQLHVKDFHAAEATYKRELSLLDQLAGPSRATGRKWKATIYHQLGRVAQAQRQWPQAAGYYQQALQIKIEFNDRYAQAATYHQLGRVAQAQRQWPQAEGYYQQALQIYVEFNDRYEQASTYHNLGIVAQEQRQWPQAEQYYGQALQIFIEFNDRYNQAMTYHNLGGVAQEQRQWAQAEGYYQQALQIKIEFNDRYAQAATYHNLGVVAQTQRQWPQAEGYYQQALQLYVEFNDRYHQLGVVAQEQRQWPQAREYFMQALGTYVAFQDMYNRGIVMRSLARLWRASEDATLPAAVGQVLGVSAAEAEKLLAAAAE